MNVKTINSKALMHNLKFCLRQNKQIMVMVKASAYGHGDGQIVKLLKNKVTFFGVASLNEALRIKRYASKKNKVLIVGKSNCYFNIIKNDIHFTIDCVGDINKVIKTCKELNKKAHIHIAINTGMNRIGVKKFAEYKKMLQLIKANKKFITLSGVFTHCFDADMPNTHFVLQMKRFKKFIKIVKDKNILIHVGGSYVLNHNIPSFVNMVRIGFFMYGYGNKNLCPVLRVYSSIVKITHCKKGECVGYGNTVLKSNTLLATVSIGYADGVPRQIGGNGYVYINGKKCKIVGNICMDMLMVDVTNVNAKVGDSVLILNNALTFAKVARTSPYEILTNFAKCRAKTKIV